MKRILIAASVMSVLLIACSSETTTNPPATSDSYLPSKTGAYTVHDNVTLEDDGSGGYNETQPYQDSTVVTGTAAKSDDNGVSKTAVVHVSYVNGAPQDTIYLSQDGAKIYQLMDLGAAAGSQLGDIGIGTTWVLMADQNATSQWTGYSDSLSNVSFEYEGNPMTMNIKIMITGRKLGTESMTVDGKTVSTIKYEQNVGLTMYVEVPFLGTIPIPIAFTMNTWLGKDVGLVKSEGMPVNISVPALGFEIPIPGSRSVLVRYKTD